MMPDFLSGVDSEPAPDFEPYHTGEPTIVPNFRASDDSPHRTATREPPLTLGERLRGMRAGKAEKARNVKLPKEKKSVPNVPGQFIEAVEDFYNLMGMVAMPFDPEFAMTMVSPHKEPTPENPEPPTVAHRCAVAWDEAAQRSESVRRMLDSFTTATVWGALAAAHAPLLLILAKNHTPFGARLDPARAMEDMLRKRAAQEEEGQ